MIADVNNILGKYKVLPSRNTAIRDDLKRRKDSFTNIYLLIS